jgi:hypothetical protein
MQAVKELYKVDWPSGEVSEAFTFDTVHPDGVFTFQFRYFSDRWHCWCTTPDGDRRAVGVVPDVVSWSEYLDYGIVFDTNLQDISYSSLFNTSLYIITWV